MEFVLFQNLNADYSPESHSLDLDHYIRVVQRRRRRAKALVDFEKHDHDELGFKKNDIINVSCCYSSSFCICDKIKNTATVMNINLCVL